MRTFFVVVIAAICVSCSPFGLNPMGYEVLHEDLDTAWRKVSAMKYIPEDGNYWKSPVEFFRDGGGDCEDFAIALVYLLGPDSKSIRIYWPPYYHFIVEYDNKYIEPQCYGYEYFPSDITIVNTFSYSYSITMATVTGLKSITY